MEAAAAIRDRYPELHEEMTRSSCMLVIEFVPGRALFRSREAWTPEHLTQTMEDVGRCGGSLAVGPGAALSGFWTLQLAPGAVPVCARAMLRQTYST